MSLSITIEYINKLKQGKTVWSQLQLSLELIPSTNTWLKKWLHFSKGRILSILFKRVKEKGVGIYEQNNNKQNIGEMKKKEQA